MAGASYRREIDGLRALAVLPVVLFHAGIPGFGGGFVGVDVFFVISGYLIGGILLGDLAAGRFSLAAFYERRARRILPALFLVMLACLPPALLWMTPPELASFGQSLAAVALFCSNFLFAPASGYFDAAAEDMPLLHTWSLGVEEQFYLLFPLLLVLAWPLGLRRLGWTMALLAALSLAGTLLDWRQLGLTAFFLSPIRAWELLAGVLLAIAEARGTLAAFPAAPWRPWLAVLGLGLVLVSVVAFGPTTPTPGPPTLVPVLGTVLALAFARPTTTAGRFLGVRPLVGIGLVSYSAYLWHQPLLAFGRLAAETTPGIPESLALSTLAFMLAWVSWRFVERPFRDRARIGRKVIFPFATAGSLAFLAIGIALWLSDGLPSRLSDAQRILVAAAAAQREGYLAGECFLDENEDAAAFGRCRDDRVAGRPTLFLWGDSHAAHLIPGIRRTFGDRYNLVFRTASLCPPLVDNDVPMRPHCRRIVDHVVDTILRERPDRLVIASAWTPAYDLGLLGATVRRLQAGGITHIDVVGPVPRWTRGLPETLRRFDRPFAALPDHVGRGLDRSVPAFDRKLAAFVSGLGARYVSLVDLACNERGCLARTGDAPATMLSWDASGHLTRAGAEYLVERFPP